MGTAKLIAGAVTAPMTYIGQGIVEMQMEFGSKLSAEAGAVLTSGGVEGNFTVSIKMGA